MPTSNITTKESLVHYVNKVGFLPFFRNHIPGFSLEDMVEPDYWYDGFSDKEIKWPAWSWREEIAKEKSLIYGKFFRGKAGFISRECFSDFCNYRRQGYDYDALYDDGLMKKTDKEMVDFLNDSGPMLTSQMKKELGFGKNGKSGFDAITNRLQMQTYIGVTEFKYKVAKKTGQPYGWGVAVLDTAEHCWGEELCRGAYHRSPEESLERIVARLSQSVPECKEADIIKLLKA